MVKTIDSLEELKKAFEDKDDEDKLFVVDFFAT